MVVEMYTRKTCPYCIRAKMLLASKGVSFHETEISGRGDLRQEMIDRSGKTTVPQIFINGAAIGGFDDMAALDRVGKLDRLLESTSDEPADSP